MTLIERLCRHRRIDDNGCWLWTGYVTPKGYGRMRWDGTPSQLVSRLAWQAWIGPIPEGVSVLHSCDTPACFNPEHLRLGTDLDNARDRDKRHRTARKVTLEQAAAIRADKRLQREIAADYGITQTAVSSIKRDTPERRYVRRVMRRSSSPVWPRNHAFGGE